MKSYFSPRGGLNLGTEGMRYREFDIGNPVCIRVVLSGRAYAAVLAHALRDGREETGGVFLGRVCSRIWYVTEAAELSVGNPAAFSWDPEEVRTLTESRGGMYQEPLEVLGFWHRHPGGMDYFSQEDEQVLQKGDWPCGQLAMLVNADPDLRLSFYCCFGGEIMPVEYEHGDAYFLEEFLAPADAETLTKRYGGQVRVKPHRGMDPARLPKSLRQRPETAPEANPEPTPEAPEQREREASPEARSVRAEETGEEALPASESLWRSAEGAALAKELMRQLERAASWMPSSYMMRLRDQNERILALLEALLREELLREPRIVQNPEIPAPQSAPKQEGSSGTVWHPDVPPEDGEVSGKINDLRVKYATEGGRRGWGV